MFLSVFFFDDAKTESGHPVDVITQVIFRNLVILKIKCDTLVEKFPTIQHIAYI